MPKGEKRDESGNVLTPSPLSCAAIDGARGEAFSLAPVASILPLLSIQRLLLDPGRERLESARSARG
jgi:hypothetical protein